MLVFELAARSFLLPTNVGEGEGEGKNNRGKPHAQENHSASFLLDALGSSHSSSGAADEENLADRVSTSGDAASESTRAEGIRLALRERGFIDGQNMAMEYRYAEGKQDRLAELAAELVRLKIDLIVVAGGNRVIQAAKNAIKTIPIVMTGGASDPVAAGSVESLARPGGNVTGISSLGSELGGKRLEILKEAVPKLSRVAILYDPGSVAPVLELKEVLPVAARALKLTLQPWEIRTADDFEKVFAAMGKQRLDALYVLGGRLMTNDRRTVGFALKSRLPDVQQEARCRSRWAHVLRSGPNRTLPARRILRGQNS